MSHNVKKHRVFVPVVLCTMLAALLGALSVSPAAAKAEQVVFTLVDEPAPWEFEDPCTGVDVHGEGVENGTVRITDLGDQGSHFRVRVSGAVDLFDSDDNFVGTWTYRLTATDQIPPGGQGANHFTASGPVTYVDGRSANLQVAHHHVFDKGDVEKFPARDTAVCGGQK